jgi:hypothetical protein
MRRTGGTFYGVEYSLKGPASLEDKLRNEVRKGKGKVSMEAAFDATHDVVRYTYMAKGRDTIMDEVAATLKGMRKKGFTVEDMGTTYTLQTGETVPCLMAHVRHPNGQVFEFQWHTRESQAIVHENHPLYEVVRDPALDWNRDWDIMGKAANRAKGVKRRTEWFPGQRVQKVLDRDRHGVYCVAAASDKEGTDGDRARGAGRHRAGRNGPTDVSGGNRRLQPGRPPPRPGDPGGDGQDPGGGLLRPPGIARQRSIGRTT